MSGDPFSNENKAHSIMIESFNGDATFKMDLNGDHQKSDMIYLKKAQGNISVFLNSIVTAEDIGDTGLRFATVGKGSNVNINSVFAVDEGAFNVEYTVDSDEYKGHQENDEYNNDPNDENGGFGHDKPGSDTVDAFFDDKTDSKNNILKNREPLDEAVDETTNYKIVDFKAKTLSTVGQTIINMTRANYTDAIYTDSLKQRLAQIQYLNGESGLWFRNKFDKVGKKDAFKSENNMFELGYDINKANIDSDLHIFGLALDYMDGKTYYDGISGDGEITRIGLWAYDTWLFNNGYYLDNIIKFGALKSKFDITNRQSENITGEYRNESYTISSELGYTYNRDRFFIEPQLQLQYTYISSADYTTTQDTYVDIGSIHSLIGRAGFRLGLNFTNSNIYLKSNILHEFLGSQSIQVADDTTNMNNTSLDHENSSTWYTVGIGAQTVLFDNIYLHCDLEESFGDDLEDSYQINAGVKVMF